MKAIGLMVLCVTALLGNQLQPTEAIVDLIRAVLETTVNGIAIHQYHKRNRELQTIRKLPSDYDLTVTDLSENEVKRYRVTSGIMDLIEIVPYVIPPIPHGFSIWDWTSKERTFSTPVKYSVPIGVRRNCRIRSPGYELSQIVNPYTGASTVLSSRTLCDWVKSGNQLIAKKVSTLNLGTRFLASCKGALKSMVFLRGVHSGSFKFNAVELNLRANDSYSHPNPHVLGYLSFSPPSKYRHLFDTTSRFPSDPSLFVKADFVASAKFFRDPEIISLGTRVRGIHKVGDFITYKGDCLYMDGRMAIVAGSTFLNPCSFRNLPGPHLEDVILEYRDAIYGNHLSNFRGRIYFNGITVEAYYSYLGINSATRSFISEELKRSAHLATSSRYDAEVSNATFPPQLRINSAVNLALLVEENYLIEMDRVYTGYSYAEDVVSELTKHDIVNFKYSKMRIFNGKWSSRHSIWSQVKSYDSTFASEDIPKIYASVTRATINKHKE